MIGSNRTQFTVDPFYPDIRNNQPLEVSYHCGTTNDYTGLNINVRSSAHKVLTAVIQEEHDFTCIVCCGLQGK